MTPKVDCLSHWPEELREVRAYLPYRLIPRGSGRLGKVPSRMTRWGLRPVDPHDARHHLTLQQALALTEWADGDGVGIVLHPERVRIGGQGVVAVDLDNVVTDGVLLPEARTIVERLASHTHVSVSGRGVHVLALGALLVSGRRGHVGGVSVELIDRGFVALGTACLPGVPAGVEARPSELLALHTRLVHPASRSLSTPAPALGLNDEAVLTAALSGRRGARVRALLAGDTRAYEGDRSRADLALLAALCRHTPDREQLRRLWAESALYRPERWARRAARDGRTYAELTLDRALAHSLAPHTPRRERPDE